jgi:ABC-type transporter Mla MlaB component
MPVEFKNNTAILTDLVSIEDAESLFNWLLERKKPKMDLSELSHIHTACLQLLLVFKPEIIAHPEQEDLKYWLTTRQ